MITMAGSFFCNRLVTYKERDYGIIKRIEKVKQGELYEEQVIY